MVTAHPRATEAGTQAFEAGGNAIDAAVAAAWALCVCEPSGSGLGGQTVAMLRLRSGRTVLVEGHSHAPAQVSRRAVSRPQQRLGHRATTVPTTPATLRHLQERYGTLPMPVVLAPAIRLAAEGYEITPLQSRQLQWCREALLATSAASDFLCDGQPYRAGQRFSQPKLATCLHRLAEHGVEDFYRGQIARAIAEDMEQNEGLLSLSDLHEVSPPLERVPLSLRYRGHVVLTNPPPGGGQQLIRALGQLQQLDPVSWPDQPDEWSRCVAMAIHDAFVERELRQGQSFGESRLVAATVGDAAPLELAGIARERGGETTHLCTADVHGNVVSMTQSIQSLFGAKVANPQYGFLYNNYLTTCPRRRGHAYRLSAGCPARSNAAPTLVVSGGGGAPMLAIGAAGSRRIISSLVQVISGVVDRDMALPDAVAQPRLHPRLSGRVWLERPAATPRLVTSLAEVFGGIDIRPRHSYAMGAVQALQVTDHAAMLPAADPRRDGNGHVV